MERIDSILLRRVPNYWLWLDEKEFYLRELEKSYRKPQYDPLETFKPPKTLINDCLRTMKAECYEIIQEQKAAEQLPDWARDYKLEHLASRHKELISKIRSYSRYTAVGPKGSQEGFGRIAQADVERAQVADISVFCSGKLRKVGNRYYTKCPFHQEKTPSFVIYPDNSWHCFGCGANGNAIMFVMRMQNLKFREAVNLLLNQ